MKNASYFGCSSSRVQSRATTTASLSYLTTTGDEKGKSELCIRNNLRKFRTQTRIENRT